MRTIVCLVHIKRELKPVFFAWSSSFFSFTFFSLFVVSLTTSPSKSDCRKIPCRRRMERIWMSETYERDSSPFVVVAKSELLNYLPVHFPSIPHHCCGVHVNGKISALTSELNNYNLWFMQSRSLFIVFCMQFMPIDNRFWSAANCCHIWCGIVQFIFNSHNKWQDFLE